MAERADLILRRQPAWQFELSGQVQGVGFRPFVYRLACELGLRGEVKNQLGTVRVIAQGDAKALSRFQRRLTTDAPPLSQPTITRVEQDLACDFDRFQILASEAHDKARIFVPPDYFSCPDCLRELHDPADRRYRYPFINCTQCGPRYTLVRRMPYDRPNTSMSGFPLCKACLAEYENPADRRFHAEPVACPDCGPHLRLDVPASRDICHQQAALDRSLQELRAGRIVAVKGIGGYHLMCDAANPSAVALLRKRKHRPHKPFAVMFPMHGKNGLDILAENVLLHDNEAELLLSPLRPIVLVRKKPGCSIAESLAPGLNELGVFLPYSPLHELLLTGMDGPLVATSGNISGEPVLTDNREAQARLTDIADVFLHHDRPIVRPADDSVYRRINAAMRPLRLGRGVAPVEATLPIRQREPLICTGGHMKATVTLSWDDRAVTSPHIGEMDSPRSLAVFEQVLQDLQNLYGVQASRIVCDAHPGYATSRWARQQGGLPLSTVWHHHAHASALTGELALAGPWLVFTWDGVGLGEDGTLWGGEALYGDAGHWRRLCSLRPFSPPGGDRAAREPWRSAAALHWETGREWSSEGSESDLATHAWRTGLNCPSTSAAGRLFDAAASMILKTEKVSFEAQGPMLLEALCRGPGVAAPLPLVEDEHGVFRSDWEPLLDPTCDPDRCPVERAENFHSTMAQVLVDQACAVRDRHGAIKIGLAGGVFQNRLLTEQAQVLLQAAGFDVYMNRRLPCNDAALSFGQAVEQAAQLAPGGD